MHQDDTDISMSPIPRARSLSPSELKHQIIQVQTTLAEEKRRSSPNPFAKAAMTRPTPGKRPQAEHARITELTQRLSELKQQLDDAMTVKAREMDDKHDDDPLNRRGVFAPNPENDRVLTEVCNTVQNAAVTPQHDVVVEKCATYFRDAQSMTLVDIQRAFNEICKEVREYCDIDSNNRPECEICQTHSAMITMGGRPRRARKSVRRIPLRKTKRQSRHHRKRRNRSRRIVRRKQTHRRP